MFFEGKDIGKFSAELMNAQNKIVTNLKWLDQIYDTLTEWLIN